MTLDKFNQVYLLGDVPSTSQINIPSKIGGLRARLNGKFVSKALLKSLRPDDILLNWSVKLNFFQSPITWIWYIKVMRRVIEAKIKHTTRIGKLLPRGKAMENMGRLWWEGIFYLSYLVWWCAWSLSIENVAQGPWFEFSFFVSAFSFDPNSFVPPAKTFFFLLYARHSRHTNVK